MPVLYQGHDTICMLVGKYKILINARKNIYVPN